MNNSRRVVRKLAAALLGAKPDLRIYWPATLPLTYVNNPKAGCSTIKNALKAAQAACFDREGKTYTRLLDPHDPDDCIRVSPMSAAESERRLLFTCVRNPYARALSAYLDKVEAQPDARFREHGNASIRDFEQHLTTLASFPAGDMNSHFRPQVINLGLPAISYGAIFVLEDLAPFAVLMGAFGDSETLSKFAPHARSSLARFDAHYTPKAFDLVRRIYADDFNSLGYSLDPLKAGEAPFRCIVGNQRIAGGATLPKCEDMLATHRGRSSLSSTLTYLRLIERRVI